MKNKRKHIMVLSLILSLLIGSVNAYASITPGGEDGTLENPFTSVDYTNGVDETGKSFEDWAASGNDGDGYYFAPDCTFKNLAASGSDAEYRFIPVYKPEEKEVTVYASGGKIDGNTSKTITVNYENGTIDPDEEILEQNENKKLGTVLSGTFPEMDGYIPYFYEYDQSSKNRRLFIVEEGADLPEEATASEDVSVWDAYYDTKLTGDEKIYVVYKDTPDATDWKQETKEKAKIIAFDSRCSTGADYEAMFGGKANTHPYGYGCFSAKKLLPGALNTTYKWTLKKGDEEKESQTTDEFSQNSISKALDGAELTEVLTYGPSDNIYTLTTKPITYTVYGRPAITSVTIE